MTAALYRAAEALMHPDDSYRCNTPNPTVAPVIALEVLSAALTDPDDPDWLARVIESATNEWLHLALSTPVGDAPSVDGFVAAAVRAAILGDGS